MAYPPNHTFSAPVELQTDPAWTHARLFAEDRRDNVLIIRTGRISGANVVNVADDDQLDDALRAAAVDLLGTRYPYVRGSLVRSALRGSGRDRFR